ncbi:MAG TPA: DMT family transporter [Frankiaceae bacterium]|nr:DMT family transporter [Frankiaceae bacterium]
MAALLALIAAVSWGLADFLGGAASRRLPTSLVMLWSQLAGLVCIGLVLLAGGWRTPGPYLWWGAAAGAFSILGTGFFYRALALGTMSIAAPIAGTGLVVPVVVGLASGERPSVVAVLGILLAAFGVVLASGPELRGEGGQRRSVAYAACAAVGFGGALALIPRGGEDRWAMTTAVLGVVSVSLTLAYVLAVRPSAPGFAGSDPAPVVAIGILNVVALSLYAISAGRGLVAVVSVLASLYPVVTVILAQLVYGERLRGVQLGGVAAAFAGVVCLALG